MSWLDYFTEPVSNTSTQRLYGVVIGVVTNIKDEKGLGRVKLQFPWLSEQEESNWARIAVPMAGNDRGFYFLPEVGDEVLVAFEHGNPSFPYVVGVLWNGKDKPPIKNDDGKNDLRVIKSRSGHIIRLDDTADQEKIEIIDKSGSNKITFDTAKNTITITSDKDIKLSAPKGTITLDAQKIDIKANTTIDVKATTEANINANANLNLKGGIINLN
ncbi:MAG: phage baseplate assembly protein V [Leptolyngbyaceae cyanobacterium bins.302]|nr:phage baseplate assembly protein V [Leptolyngbyaceae cyanobacterium bins.302]